MFVYQHYYSLAYLRGHLLSDIGKCTCGINIFPIDNLRNVQKNKWLSMDETIEDMPFQSLVIVVHILSLAYFEGIVTVGEDDGM